MNIFTTIWDTVISHPMINSLAFLYDLLWDNIGLSIIVFTILIRLLLIPLTIRQTRQTKKLSAMQPKIKALQAKYAGKDPETRRKLSQETMRVYKEAGVNPVGCLGPLIIQIPIWIGLYRAILLAVPVTPAGFVDLSRALYSWNPAISEVPYNALFLGIDLVQNTSQAGVIGVVLAVLVGVTLFLQQKVSAPASADPQQRTTSRMLLFMLPVVFAFLSWNFPAGLALYILSSNIIGVLIQYFVAGRPPITIMGRRIIGKPQEVPAGAAVEVIELDEPEEEENGTENEKAGVYRKNRRRSNRTGTKTTKGKS